MLIVVTLMSLLFGISFPSLTAGIESLRISSACDEIATAINGALNRAERRQQGVEILVLPHENVVAVASFEPGHRRRVEMPPGVTIAGDQPRQFLVFPGSSPPRVAILLVNRRGDRRAVRIDPVSGAPLIERLNPGQEP